MMEKTFYMRFYANIAFAIFIAALLIYATLAVVTVSAQGIEDIEFPIAELGGCENEEECKNYCDNPEHISECIDFAESHGLMNKKEAEKARKLSEFGEIEGPGGCKGEDECEEYCENPDNMRECILFAKEHGIMPPEEIEEAEKILGALEAGAVLPGGCTGKIECEAYCEDENHTEECVAFAEAAGFMSREEAEMVRKTGGKGPGGCRGKDECDAFCENPDNMRECILFGKEHGLMPPEELKNVEGMLRALESGVKPPACKGREKCDKYCSDPANSEECFAFAVAAGFVDEKDAKHAREMFEKGITKGPGGCKKEEECKSFCENPDNMNECMDFSVRAGHMTQEEFERNKEMMERGMRGGPGGCQSEEECMRYCENPDHREECMKAAIESGKMPHEEFERMKSEMERMRESGEFMEHKDFEHYEEGDFREHFEIDDVPEEFHDFIRVEGKPLYEGVPENFEGEINRYEEEYKEEGFEEFKKDFISSDEIMQQEIERQFKEEFQKFEEEFGDFENMMPPQDFTEEFHEPKEEFVPSNTDGEPTSLGPKNILGLILMPIMELLK